MFSFATLTAITEIVIGGSGDMQSEPIGIYRKGSVIETLLGYCGIRIQLGSRVPTVRSALLEANETPEGVEKIKNVIRRVIDPREFVSCPEKLSAVVSHLNQMLRDDGFEVRNSNGKATLVALSAHSAVTDALLTATDLLNLESVRTDLERAVAHADSGPEDAVTAACSKVESVFKCILEDLKQPYPSNQDIAGFAAEVEKHLKLSPGRADIDGDVKRILPTHRKLSRRSHATPNARNDGQPLH